MVLCEHAVLSFGVVGFSDWLHLRENLSAEEGEHICIPLHVATKRKEKEYHIFLSAGR